ncbi:HupE/UreJ family protein [Ruegeria sp. HKCCA5929]|uniref:HupE/UreJ family protein n=1 Tax=Ruegeria sp. HKCCA5929 TaxID=2682988 RepID=UPI0014898567|nr:HupE/UreJ family protein [Ruegeria sp. HKCCA5929]
MLRHIAFILGLGVLTIFQATAVHAHALEPGYLEITETGPESYRIFWRKPDVQGQPMAIGVSLPEQCEVAHPLAPYFDGAAWVSSWETTCGGGIAGANLAIPGLEHTQTDVLVRVHLLESLATSARLTPTETTFLIPAETTRLSVLVTYVELGTEHILEGFDHLLFVFALLFLIRDVWRLIGAITAFTVAHSITLALASLGLLHVPAPPVEAVIALSIVFLAVEIAKRNHDTLRLSERWPWIVSFSFGLLHGLGFAGALSEIGLPQGDIFVALLGFNIGVEIGQLLFVGVVLTLGVVFIRLIPAAGRIQTEQKGLADTIVSYAIGAIASYWLVERVVGFWT